METTLLLYTDAAVRRVLEARRPGRLIFASDDVGAADRAVYDECVVLPPVWKVEETVEAIDRIQADRVFYQTEFGLPPGSLLAARKGWKGPSPEAVHRCLNKWASRLALAEADVPVPGFRLASSADEIREGGCRYPLVVKPIASTLGRLVTKVSGPEELDARVSALLAALPTAPDVLRLLDFARLAGIDLFCDPTREFLVEEFEEGPPLETDGLVFGDRIDYFGVTSQVVRDGPGFYIEAYLFPAALSDLQNQRFEAVTRAAVKAVGLQDSGFSIEFRGHKVIEVNGRLGEDDGFPDLFRAGLGEFPILKALAGDDRPSHVTGHHALAYVNCYAPGIVRSVVVPPGVTALVQPGSRIFPPGTPEYRAHVAYALASHPTSSRAAHETARSVVDAAGIETG